MKKILETLKSLTGGEKVLDMLVSNFVYEKLGQERHKVMPRDYPTCSEEGEAAIYSAT